MAGVKDLVTLPDVAMRIARMVNDPTASASDIGREIGRDAALTARLLRIANSPSFGQYGKIATVSRAITVLGVRQVRDLTVGLTAVRAFDGISNELVTMESFWRHSLLCAVAAAHIAAHRGAEPGESAFVAGLLHDIGQLVLFSRAQNEEREALLMSIDALMISLCTSASSGCWVSITPRSAGRWRATGGCRRRCRPASACTTNPTRAGLPVRGGNRTCRQQHRRAGRDRQPGSS